MRAACLPSTEVTVTVNGHALQELQHYFQSIEFTVYLNGVSMGGSVVDLCDDGKQNMSVSGFHENYRGGIRFRGSEFASHEMGTFAVIMMTLLDFIWLINYSSG
jgi:hypothetical protein